MEAASKLRSVIGTLAARRPFHHSLRVRRQTTVNAKLSGRYYSYSSRNYRIYCHAVHTMTTTFMDEKKAQQQQPRRRREFSTNGKNKTSDPPVWTWVDRVLPTHWQPYARIARVDKPIGTMLLLWPCLWSTAVAAGPGNLPDPWLMGLFGVGAFAMRGAGCTINDMWDADLDRKVARTATRPLAAGIVSQRQALVFLSGQLAAGLAVLLSLPHTYYCFQLGCMSLPLVAIYPATKRFFPFPQAFLGLTLNWGAFMGWAAVHGNLDLGVVAPLFCSGVTWTLVYDTLYAHQDKDDDAKLQLQSTALTFGDSDVQQRVILHALAVATCVQWSLVGTAADLALSYYAGVAVAYSHLIWQIQTADFKDPYNLAARFRSNSTVGGIVFAALVAGTYAA